MLKWRDVGGAEMPELEVDVLVRVSPVRASARTKHPYRIARRRLLVLNERISAEWFEVGSGQRLTSVSSWTYIPEERSEPAEEHRESAEQE